MTLICSCGEKLIENRKSLSWEDFNGEKYSILNVPYLCCSNGCENSIDFHSNEQLNLKILMEEMELGTIPKKIDYKKIEESNSLKE